MMLHPSRQRKRNGRTLVVVRSGKSTAVAFVNIDRPAFDAQWGDVLEDDDGPIEETFTIEPFPSRMTGTKAWVNRNTLTGSAGAGRRDRGVAGARRRLTETRRRRCPAFAQ
jgi:hypothetical protein